MSGVFGGIVLVPCHSFPRHAYTYSFFSSGITPLRRCYL